jgi:tRNA nucleotidyltransferase (CCA-adding enzyme)
MAKAGSGYPQVDPGAAGLMDPAILTGSPRARVRHALDALERASATAMVLGHRAAVRRDDLRRAVEWGLGTMPAGDLAWVGLPCVPASASEVSVRRCLMRGAPMVIVAGGGGPLGLVDGTALPPMAPPLSVLPRLERPGNRNGEARVWLLRVAGKIGEALGMPTFAVGGFVRDLLLERDPLDVDLVVEGDGITFARRLAEEVRGHVVMHSGFGTAAIKGAATGDGIPLHRIDIATAREERYGAPGALPVVRAAPLARDLRRRDFSVNAMAISLLPSEFGRLVDPVGGQQDLRARRLRPLHPLSFVEDPTRIFRAACYAARLGLRLERQGVQALRLALRVGPYPALSGQRLHAELALIAAEPAGWAALRELLRWGAFALWDPRYRPSPAARARLAGARGLARRFQALGVALDPEELALVALLLDQPAAVAARCLDRLAVTGEPRVRLEARATAAALARWLESHGRRRPSATAAALRPAAPAVLIGAWLLGGRGARQAIEWFLRQGHAVRPLLSGDELVKLGVPRGPQVARCLGRLRDRRLDGAVSTRAGEQALVERWVRRARTEKKGESR